MKTQIAAAAALAVLGTAAAAVPATAASVEVRHAVARVVVIPENRTDIKVEAEPGAGSAAGLPRITTRTGLDGKLIIDGGLERRVRGCNGGGEHASDLDPANIPATYRVRVRDLGDVLVKDAPLIVIRTPMDVHVDAGDAVFGAVGRADSVHLGASGCGDWTVANVKGELHISSAGSGDVRTGSAGDVKANIAGSGDIRLGDVKSIDASIAGSGDVYAQTADGSVKASIAGSGDVQVRGGRIATVKASIAGSGDVKVDAAVNDVDASIMGSGDVRVASAAHISKMVMGSGSVVVGK
ncbi:MAG TPA: DUF2807 domain-containing protein [Caulobacteraceae bacterium]|nr:DUF2807 domain-containing protein [Caulobacteraceae bacterium]